MTGDQLLRSSTLISESRERYSAPRSGKRYRAGNDPGIPRWASGISDAVILSMENIARTGNIVPKGAQIEFLDAHMDRSVVEAVDIARGP